MRAYLIMISQPSYSRFYSFVLHIPFLVSRKYYILKSIHWSAIKNVVTDMDKQPDEEVCRAGLEGPKLGSLCPRGAGGQHAPPSWQVDVLTSPEAPQARPVGGSRRFQDRARPVLSWAVGP